MRTPEAGVPWENPVRRKLRNGEPVFGVTLTTPSLDAAARAAGLGFDFLWIELEHSPITLETAHHIVLATRGLGAVPVARLPVNELWTAKRALDMGMAGVIFPFTGTAALAEQAVEACRSSSEGCGSSSSRSGGCVCPAIVRSTELRRCSRQRAAPPSSQDSVNTAWLITCRRSDV